MFDLFLLRDCKLKDFWRNVNITAVEKQLKGEKALFKGHCYK